MLVSDWLISKKSSSLKLLSQMNWNLVESNLWRVLYKVSSKHNERWATQAQPTEPLVGNVIICLTSHLPIICNIRVVTDIVTQWDQRQNVQITEGRLWSWSYGSWNYSYLYNHCEFNTTLCDKVFSDLRQVGGFLRILLFPPPIKLIATIKLKYC